MTLTKNFSSEEFECKCGCDEVILKMALVDKLQCIRDLMDEPIIINSGFRCYAHNEAIGGKPHSAHTYGFAVDLQCPSSAFRSKILPFLIASFNRIGIGPDFIHVDIDETKPQNVIWVY